MSALYRATIDVIVEAENDWDAERTLTSMLDGNCNGRYGSRVLTWDQPLVDDRPLSKDDVLRDHRDEPGTVEALDRIFGVTP